MKIEFETKFNVGDKVWFLMHGLVHDGVICFIEYVLTKTGGLMTYGVVDSSVSCFRFESELFATEDEALKCLNER